MQGPTNAGAKFVWYHGWQIDCLSRRRVAVAGHGEFPSLTAAKLFIDQIDHDLGVRGTRMSQSLATNLSLAKEWLMAFRAKDVDTMMRLFTDDIVVTLGAGGSGAAASYTGTFSGKERLSRFYSARFSDPALPARVACGIEWERALEHGDFVMIPGNITDRILATGETIFDGKVILAFTIRSGRISAFEMFMET